MNDKNSDSQRIHHDTPIAAPQQQEFWGSDAIAAMLREIDIPFLALNPGASYRGLHDSLVNFLGNQRPQMLLCLHEESAVSIAQGYAKVANKMMGVVVHSPMLSVIAGVLGGVVGGFVGWLGGRRYLIIIVIGMSIGAALGYQSGDRDILIIAAGSGAAISGFIANFIELFMRKKS